MKVFKFGGASVKDAAGIMNLVDILKHFRDEELLIVVSAIGKTTNALEAVTRAYLTQSSDLHLLLNAVKEQHMLILQELFPDKNNAVYDLVANTFTEVDWVLEEEHDDAGYVYDQIVSAGELLSTQIVTAALAAHGLPCVWQDARSCIYTDNTYREAKVDMPRSTALIGQYVKIAGKKGFIITQGFIGGTSENYTTTLGREGSDYTAAIFGAALGAESVTIWKDVPGVLTADPKLFSHAKKYDELSYADAIEMTYYGATVIHPKTIKPLQNAGIPLFVKPFYDVNEPGTRIAEKIIPLTEPAIIIKQQQVLLSVSTHDFSFITEEHLSRLFADFSTCRISINMMQISALSFSVCVDEGVEKLERLKTLLKETFYLKYNTGLQLITVRHFHAAQLTELISGKEVLLEQLSRHTAQVVMR